MSRNHKLIVIAVLGVVLLGAFIYSYRLQRQVGYGAINYVNQEIPAGFQFTNDQPIPDEWRLDPVYTAIQMRDKNVHDRQFICQKGGEQMQIIEYSNFTAGYGILGGWRFRYAVACGDEYIVIDGHDATGIASYGPFFLKR